MKKKYAIKEEIERTMASLDDLQRLEGDPDLYEKIMKRVKKQPGRTIPLYRRRPVAAAAAILLLAVNLLSVRAYIKTNQVSAEENYYEALMEDYDQSLMKNTEIQDF